MSYCVWEAHMNVSKYQYSNNLQDWVFDMNTNLTISFHVYFTIIFLSLMNTYQFHRKLALLKELKSRQLLVAHVVLYIGIAVGKHIICVS